MPRKKLIRTDQFPYHVTIRSNNADWFDLPMTTMWHLCQTSLEFSLIKEPVEVHAFVLMNNHYHMVLRTPKLNIDKFFKVFNSRISREIRRRTNRKNRVFGDRYKWKIITDQGYYFNVIRYVFQNPVRAKLCTNVEDYPFSSIFYQVRAEPVRFIDSGLTFDLNYLNSCFTSGSVNKFKSTLWK